MNETDLQLLARYAQERADDAFAELVHRHLSLVYSAALRQVQSPELAQEVAQSVFLDLARQAATLPRSTNLTAWLFQVARRTAIDVVRHETRRQTREQIAHQLSAMNSPSADWTEIEHLLDEAVQSLDPDDRAAILLRYFANKSLRDVGHELGSSENAAQKRLTRALERLSQFFSRRGVRVSSAALLATLSANATQAVPAGLGLAITSFVAQSAATTTAAIATTGILTMSALKTTAVAITLLAAASIGIYQTHQASHLKSELVDLKAQPPSGQLTQLATERDEALRQLSTLQARIQTASSTNPELMRLRDEVSRLKREASESAAAKNAGAQIKVAAQSWLTRVNRLKERLQQTAEAQVPELQLLTHEDWLAAVKNPELDTEADFRRAFSTLRNTAQNKLASLIQPAIKKYQEANNGAFPSDLAQLYPHLESSFEPALLSRYAIFPEKEAPYVKMGGDWIVTQKKPVDAEFDQRIVIGPNGFGSSSYPSKDEPTEAEFKALEPAYQAYKAANDNREPVNPQDVAPYLATAEAKAAYDKVLKFRAASNKSARSTVAR